MIIKHSLDLSTRTQNIIYLCKRRYPQNIDVKEAIKNYMSEICFGNLDWAQDYTDADLLGIIEEVVVEYCGLNTSRKLLTDYFNASKKYDQLDAWISALCLLQIKDFDDTTNSYYYINGFTNDNIINENTNEIMYQEN